MKPLDWKSMTPVERIEAVKPMIAEGDLSASMIAARFENCSRFSVIGLVHRYDLKGGRFGKDRKTVPIMPQAPRVKRRSPPKRQPAEAETTPKPERFALPPMSPPPDNAKPISFARAISPGVNVCKWPLWGEFEGPNVSKCCGADRDVDRPYCDHHMRLSRGRGTESERSAAKVLEKFAL